MRQKFEYKLEPVNKTKTLEELEKIINKIAKDGWELYWVQPHCLTFKRIIETRGRKKILKG